MKNLMVTGGAGFIGSNFIRFLLEKSDFAGRIVNVDSLTYAGNLENLADIGERYPDRYVFARADICDLPAIGRILDAHRIDAVCHFAAESHVDRSIAAPDGFIQTNIIGTFNLLELVRERLHRIQRFHHVSTDEVYGSLGSGGYFKEDTPYDPSSPYSASKAASDHLVNAYHRTYGIPVTLSNCSNNYGPYQFPEKLIPLTILNALAGRTLPVYGDGRNVRDWLHVADHCRAIWQVMQKGAVGRTYNIGGNCEKTNIDVVETICDCLDEMLPAAAPGTRRDLIRFVKDRPGHDRRYAIDSRRIKTELGWTPGTSFEAGIEQTIRWYRENPEWVERIISGEYRRWIEKHYGRND